MPHLRIDPIGTDYSCMIDGMQNLVEWFPLDTNPTVVRRVGTVNKPSLRRTFTFTVR